MSEAAKRFYSGPGGLVRLLSTDSVKVGGQEMSRQVYCLKSDPSQRFMRIRDVAKVATMADIATLGAQIRAQSRGPLTGFRV